MEATTAAPQAAKAPPILSPERFKGAEFERQIYIANADEGHTVLSILESGYWAHVAQLLRPWDRIEVRANDQTWWAELMVLDAGRNWVNIHLLRSIDLSQAQNAEVLADTSSPYEAKWSGPQLKWAVIRKADQARVVEGLTDKGAAAKWIEERLKAGV